MQKLIPTPCYDQTVFCIISLLYPNMYNFFKPAFVAVEAIVLTVLLYMYLDSNKRNYFKVKNYTSDMQLLDVKTLIDKSLFWGLSSFYVLVLSLNYTLAPVHFKKSRLHLINR
jgi:hypothetical protein